jgi:hypothetical protein
LFQIRVRSGSSRRQLPIHRSMIEFIRGAWTAARGWSAEDDGDVTMRLEVVPPLSPAIAWIEVLAAGQSVQARATLPLRWQ